MASLDSVAGLESFWPTYPPTATSRPAALAGSAASSTACASSTPVSPEPVSSATEM
jgi:hypothetical protein